MKLQVRPQIDESLERLPERAPQNTDYAALKRRVQEAGLLDRQPAYSLLVIATNAVLILVCLWLLVVFQNPWVRALDAVFLGLVSAQLGFQLHDSGHRQMFAKSWKNELVGLLTADVLLGMSYGWWVDKHNRHHGKPNQIDMDPDIDIGVISYTRDQALEKRGLMKFIAAYQAYMFFPLLFGLAWSMHVTGTTFLIKQRTRFRTLELLVLPAHAIGYLVLMVALVGPWQALMVIVIQKCVGGFCLASVFAPNHKGMLQLGPGETLDFLRAQVLTARNVRANPVTDLFYGSLNYQIEHHLFPGMARNKTRRAQKIVRQFCNEIGVEYYETSIVQSYREILSFLHEVGEPLRRGTRPKIDQAPA